MYSVDFFLEVARAIVLIVIVVCLWRFDQKKAPAFSSGWKYVKFGFLLLLIGSVADILNYFVHVSPFTVGVYLAGFTLLAIGLIKCGPLVAQASDKDSDQKKTLVDLQENLSSMEKRAEERTVSLKEEIIERKQTEDLLRESEIKSRALLENSPICNKIIDLNSRLVYMSSAGIKMLKISNINEHYGTVYPPDFYAESMRAPLVDHLNRAKNGEVSDVECPLLSTEGDEVWLHTTFVPSRNDSGKVEYVIATSVDITERKKAELDAHRAIIDAEHANLAKSEFLANMSHDLRTPLNAIVGFTEMMETETFGPLGHPRYEEYAKDIRNSGNFLVSLINDILDISKIEAGKYELVEETLDLEQIIENSVTMLSPLIKTGGLNISTHFPPSLPLLRGDERSMTQIFNNLISNAVKFTRPDGKISITAKTTNGSVQITISDTGVGMTPGEVESVFNPFEQASSAVSGPRNGTGLGLHLCKKLVTLLDGDITMESEVGVGTSVAVLFPAHRSVLRKSPGFETQELQENP